MSMIRSSPYFQYGERWPAIYEQDDDFAAIQERRDRELEDYLRKIQNQIPAGTTPALGMVGKVAGSLAGFAISATAQNMWPALTVNLATGRTYRWSYHFRAIVGGVRIQGAWSGPGSVSPANIDDYFSTPTTGLPYGNMTSEGFVGVSLAGAYTLTLTGVLNGASGSVWNDGGGCWLALMDVGV